MRLHYARMGFANNSSSDHSIVIIPGGVSDDWDGDGEFGWENFTLSSKEAKTAYLQQVLGAMFLGTSEEMRRILVEGITGQEGYDPGGYIDHESLFGLPREWGDSKYPDLTFLRDFMTYLHREDVVILGGNDNSDGHPLNCRATAHAPYGCKRNLGGEGVVARWDDEYHYWALFDRKSGMKLRVSFDDGKDYCGCASLPELVDVKITNYCDEGCAFCYQGSTPAGLHADLKRIIWSIVAELEDMHVFEVAIGGGEPTVHPRFVDILEAFREHGVVPNFTTRRLDWLENNRLRDRILTACGSFAYSVRGWDDVERLGKLVQYHEITDKAAVQCVLGTDRYFPLRLTLQKAKEYGLRVTLLDYKQTGRASDKPPEQYPDWIEEVKQVNRPIGIDTPLARRYAEQLEADNVPSYLYEVEEGAASMYIDAVGMKCYRTSYTDEDGIPFDSGFDIGKAWQQLRNRGKEES